MQKQITDHLLMVRPLNFARGTETYKDNSFMERPADEHLPKIAEAARDEFDAYVQVLREAGVKVTVMEDVENPILPNSVFPNNWFTTHDDGLFVTYPMFWPERRLERRQEIIDQLDRDFVIRRTLSLDHWEQDGRFLEGTGSLVLDRENRIAYASASERCTLDAVHDWCDAMDYHPITFHAFDARGNVIYHTNVMMAVGTKAAIICLDAITDPGERAKVQESLALTGKKLVEITLEQVDRFAGNALEVLTKFGPSWVMSTQAFRALSEGQLAALGQAILHAPLDVIEHYGGGSARCMIGEIYLEERQTAAEQ
ncbi:citrulline utilization hydrolase CtlX [Lewinella sp. W8]|uniref:citrulline utilization hydrolase CtlX n=1 Tax=Lewinella sp. W8 TaxID=2528208 RepID=UPI0015653A5B|nr:arginine deiminase-related protein [Lewinella sp. W8]